MKTRRDFVRTALLASSALTVGGTRLFAAQKASRSCPPIVVFSKIYQELKLSYDDAAALTAEAGLDGIDCPVRDGGEVLPEKVAEDLPRYAEVLRKHGLTMPLLTTGILSPSSPHAEEILRTGKSLGAQFYRVGFVYRKKNAAAADQINELKSQLKDLAALNRQIGLGALVQNHSPSGNTVYLAGDLSEMRQLLEGFNPDQMGAAFDIGHALIVHGQGWRAHFEALERQIKVAYLKDPNRERRWVPFGEGEVSHTGYIKLLKSTGYKAPVSLHIEFDWDEGGKSRNRARLLKTLKESTTVIRRWFAEV